MLANLKFKNKLQLVFIVLAFCLLGSTILTIHHVIKKTVQTKIENDFKKTVLALDTNLNIKLEEFRNAVDSALANPLFRSQVGRSQTSSDDLGLESDSGDGLGLEEDTGDDVELSEKDILKEINSIFKSTNLPFFNKYELLLIVNANYKLLYCNQSPSLYDKDYSSIKLFQASEQNGQAMDLWWDGNEKLQQLGVFKNSDKKRSIYLVNSSVITSGQEIIGYVLAGESLSSKLLIQLEKTTGINLIIQKDNGPIASSIKISQNVLKDITHSHKIHYKNIDDDQKILMKSPLKGPDGTSLNASIFLMKSYQREIGPFFKKINMSIGIIMLVAILIALLLGNLFSKGLTGPLNTLLIEVKEIMKGNFGKKINLKQKDEFGDLARNFSEMSLYLKDSYQKLEDYNKNLELKVEERTVKLKQALKELKESQAQLVQAEKMSSLGQLVAGVAHEINTPVGIGLTSATHFQEVTSNAANSFKNNKLKKSDLEKYFATSQEVSELILKNLERTAELVKGFKKVSVDQASENKRDFNLKTYLEDILLSLGPKIKSTPYQVKTNCPSDINISGYPGAVSQVITNLVLNSITHAFEGKSEGVMTIKATLDQNFVIIDYYDDGIGIPQEIHQTIFDPFVTTKRGEGGTGLGMHIVFNLLHQNLKGTISCDTDYQDGAHFVLRFPQKI